MRLTEKDLTAAMRVHFMNAIRRPSLWLFWSIVVLAFFSLMGLIIPPDPDASGAWFSVRHLPLLLLAVVVDAQILAYFVTIPLAARRTFAQQKNLGGENEMSWDATRIVSRGPHGVSDFAWGDYCAWLERDGMVLLYQSDQLFQIAPARAFPSEAERREMIERLQEAGVPRARTRAKRASAKPA